MQISRLVFRGQREQNVQRLSSRSREGPGLRATDGQRSQVELGQVGTLLSSFGFTFLQEVEGKRSLNVDTIVLSVLRLPPEAEELLQSPLHKLGRDSGVCVDGRR